MLHIDKTGRRWAALRIAGLCPERLSNSQLATALQRLEHGLPLLVPDYAREAPRFGVGWDEDVCLIVARKRAERG